MQNTARYTLWFDDASASIRSVLQLFPSIKLVRADGDHSAVVLMERRLADAIRSEFPTLHIEEDSRHRMISRKAR
jgi:hypothetical protein